MRVLLFSSLVGLAYGYANASDYIRLDFRGNGIDVTANATGNCGAAISRSFLVKPVKANHNLTQAITHPTQWTTSADRHGSCIQFALNSDDPLFTPGTAFTNSIAIQDTGNGQYTGFTFADQECAIAGVAEANGFVFNPNSTGSSDCSGVLAPASDIGGLILMNGAQVIETIGTLFLASRAISGQLNGPFTNNSCTLLAAGNSASIPIVVPLEDKAVTADTTLSEFAVTTPGICSLWHTTGGIVLMRTKTSTTKGELSFEISSGANVAHTDKTTCVNGDTYRKITFTVALNGSRAHCVQAVDSSGNGISQAFYTFPIDDESVGDWPSFPDPVTEAPTACESPASALHISTTMAIIFALIGMMM